MNIFSKEKWRASLLIAAGINFYSCCMYSILFTLRLSITEGKKIKLLAH